MKPKIIFFLAVALWLPQMVRAQSSGTCTVNWTNVFQRIDGFGASSAWRSTWSASEADMFFSTNSGLGLSLLRSRIVFSGSTSSNSIPTSVETSIMQMAQARGARVWSTPWTPAVGFKSTNDIYDSLPITNAMNGGTYLGSGNNITNLNYASQLANYVAYMHNLYGINLYAISIQNEPDASVNTYEACQWSGAQIHDFATNLFNALSLKGFGATKIMLPESQNWTDPHHFVSSVMGDSNAAANVDIIANHNYVANNNSGDQRSPAVVNSYGKALWETEVSTFDAFNAGITNGIYWAKRIHSYLTVAQANAYHYWWLIASDNSGLANNSDVMAKRGYVFGQYSRFVRPNYYRIGTITDSGTAMVSAFKDLVSSNFVIVAINPGGTTINQTFNLANFGVVTSVTPWVTSETLSLAKQTTLTLSNNDSFAYQLPANSVVSFVGKVVANNPPVLANISDQTINAGVTLVITNVATDPDSLPQTLTFNLLTNPPNASINSSNGIFTWRPFISQANTTNLVVVKVSDDALLPLSATNRFNITVNSIIQPVVDSVSFADGQIEMSVSNGMAGPDYILQTSTNLTDWQTLLTTNSPTLPFTMSDTNLSDTQRFYRLLLGP